MEVTDTTNSSTFNVSTQWLGVLKVTLLKFFTISLRYQNLRSVWFGEAQKKYIDIFSTKSVWVLKQASSQHSALAINFVVIHSKNKVLLSIYFIEN